MDTHEFSFLELNPRLQVEHPVTENILGINLPACQIQVAMGIQLHRIADIRRIYGRHPRGRDTIDFEFSERVPLTGYCIATRITAENPDSSFQPTSGKIKEIQFRPSIDVWGYFAVNSSGLIHEFSDSQFGHLFAHGKDRESARRAMVVALKELEIRGEMRTTVEYLIRLLESDDYIHDRISTQWLDARIAHQKELKHIEAKSIPACLVAICGGAVQGFQHFEAAREGFLENLRIGQVPAKDAIVKSENIELIYDNVKYTMKCNRSGPNSVIISNDIQSEEITIRLMSDGGYLLNIRGTSRRVYIQNDGAGSLRMIVDGSTFIFTPEYDPTCQRATVAGKIARRLVPDGSHVNAGEPFVEIEVMKMYMALKADEPGIVHFLLSEGAVISPGDIIATIDLDHPDKVIKAEVFAGNLLEFNDSKSTEGEELPHLIYKSSREQLEKVLDGYSLSESEIDHALATCTGALMNRLLPAYELREAMSVLEGRIDSDLYDRIFALNTSFIEDYQKDESTAKFPSGKIITAIWEFVQSNPADARAAIMSKLALVWEICEVNFHCSEVQILVMLIKFTEKFLQVENIFDDVSYSDVINRLRHLYPGEKSGTVWDLCSSHVNLEDKTTLMLQVINIMVRIPASVANQRPKYPPGVPLIHEVNARNLKVKLTELSRLRQSVYSRLSFAANIALMRQNSLNVEQRQTRLHETLVQALGTGDAIGCGERVHCMKSFVESNIDILDLFTESMQEDPDYQIAYLELYLRKIYQKTHDMLNLSGGHTLSSDQISTIPWIKFEFRTRTFGAITSPDGTHLSNLTYHDLTQLSRVDSFTNMVSDSEEEGTPSSDSSVMESTRYGAFAVFGSPEEFCSQFSLLLDKIPQSRAITPLKKSPLNALHAVFMKHNFSSVDEAIAYIESFLSGEANQATLRDHGVRRVTVVMGKVNDGSLPEHIAKIDPHVNCMMSVFTFRNTNNYREDTLYRNIEAPHAYHLDLPRLNNFSISLEEGLQTASGNVQLYRAIPNGETGPASYFARLVSFTGDEKNSEAESFFVEALDAIALALGRDSTQTRPKKSKIIASNHIFLNIVAPDVVIQPDFFEGEMRRICGKYSEKMVKLNVAIVELKLACRLHADADPISIRFNITNPTGYVLNVEQYYEGLSKGISVFRSVGATKGEWDGYPVSTPYSTSHKFDNVRAEALATSDTLYVYDWPTLFEHALKCEWKKYLKTRHHNKKDSSPKDSIPEDLFICEELIFDETQNQLRAVSREPGLNTIGMVGWLVTMKTPECRQGRQIVLIANDITFQAGSFGTKEDFFFANATRYARNLQIPRLYLAANSGARIGMAQSLKDKFSVSWLDPDDPTKGFQYLYLTSEIYDQLLQAASGDVAAMPVICSNPPLTGPDGELRYVITDIIGEESDLGVENLMGSGLIAGETSRAYTDIFTLTLVIGRTVGIGAYLVRLGQRTIQKMKNSPIILTGYQALNKLLGKEIYTTNDQLGGPMIMFPNGVTHLLAETHLDTVSKALTWLSFVPASKNSHLPVRDITGVDVVDRLVEFHPKKGISYDPRYLITGTTTNDTWESGLFDRDSFIEVLGGWAKTVVAGRARLGGIPIGIIVTENRTSEAFILADPADPTSQEKIIQQAGGVWFPDSAYKTAQVRDNPLRL
jgi:acetyl-CoA carboxylase / biotin carboxylase 1